MSFITRRFFPLSSYSVGRHVPLGLSVSPSPRALTWPLNSSCRARARPREWSRPGRTQDHGCFLVQPRRGEGRRQPLSRGAEDTSRFGICCHRVSPVHSPSPQPGAPQPGAHGGLPEGLCSHPLLAWAVFPPKYSSPGDSIPQPTPAANPNGANPPFPALPPSLSLFLYPPHL